MGLAVKIAGVDQIPTGRVQFTPNVTFTLPLLGQRGAANFRLIVDQSDDGGSPPGSPYAPVVGQPVEIDDDGVNVWMGSVDSFKILSSGPTQPFWYDVSCVSVEAQLDKRIFTGTFQKDDGGSPPVATTCGAIFTELINVIFADEGIGLGTVLAGATLTAPAVYDHVSLANVLTDLCARSGGGFIWYIKQNKAYFVQSTSVPAPFAVTGDDMLDASNPSVLEDRKDYRNRQWVKMSTNGAPQPLSEFLVGDGAKTKFTTAHDINSIVSITLTSATPLVATITFTGIPADGDTLSWGPNQGQTYTFRLFTKYIWDVAIGLSISACAANLAAAINGTGSFGWLSAAGQFTATQSGGSGQIVTLQARTPGSFVPTFTTSSAAFSASAPTQGTSGAGVPQTFAEGASAQGNEQWLYVTGTPNITQDGVSPPPTPITAQQALVVVYVPIGFGMVRADNFDEQAARKAIEGGSGVYENTVNRADILKVPDALLVANALLAAYGQIAKTLTFKTRKFGLLPGMQLNGSDARLGPAATGVYTIRQVTATYEETAEAGKHFWYSIVASSLPQAKLALDIYIKMLSGGNVAGSPGAGSYATSIAQLDSRGNASTPGVAGGGGGTTDIGFLTFGADDDTVGTNISGKYAPIVKEGAPFFVFWSMTALPSSQMAYFDIQYSTDGGNNWQTALTNPPQYLKVNIPTGPGSSLTGVFQNCFKKVNWIPADIKGNRGVLVRLDSAQAGGAKNIVIVVLTQPGGNSSPFQGAYI